jgi:anti-sigma factor RsiW
MEHEKAQELLSCYVDGTLDAESSQKLEAHLEGCEECQGNLDLLKKTLQVVGKIPSAQAPADFSARLRRKARKAGLFERYRRRPATRQMVPFAPTMAVLLAAVGGLVFSLLMFYSQLQSLTVEHPPAVLLVESKEQVNHVARATWAIGGEVRIPGKPQVPPETPLGAPPELELRIPHDAWPVWEKKLKEKGMQSPDAPPADADGRLHVIVQIRLKESARLPGEEDPASSADRPRSPPDPQTPPPGDKE